jgi:predicted secreted protein
LTTTIKKEEKMDENARIGDINIKVGQPTEVKLKNNSGTGYSWYLSHKPDCLWLDDTNVEQYTPSGPGRPFNKVFSLMGGAVGQDYIEFILVRPWLPNEIAKKVVYAVIVHE